MPKSANDKRHFYIVGVLIAVTTVVLYWLLSIGMPLPYKASVQADTIDWMIDLHLFLIAALFAVVMVFMVYSVFVFRRRPGDTEDGAHFEGNTLLEIVWTAVPLILVFIFMYLGVKSLWAITEPQNNELVIKAIGQQWSWQFQYENGVTSPELVMPVDRPVRMELESKDVIHSFWIREFRVKEDLTPGQINVVRFTATKTSAEYIAETKAHDQFMKESDMGYKVRCVELCGTGHHSMMAPAKVLTDAEFETWLKSQAAASGQSIAQNKKTK